VNGKRVPSPDGMGKHTTSSGDAAMSWLAKILGKQDDTNIQLHF